jgi:hypothetical protein
LDFVFRDLLCRNSVRTVAFRYGAAWITSFATRLFTENHVPERASW